MTQIIKILVIVGSSASICFGIWHFFVPRIWNWYSYIDIKAAELAAAIRAINVFFSLSLILFGSVNILFSYGEHSNSYSIIIMLAATTILWVTRTALQIVYPQGSMNRKIQYGMLIVFIIVSLCHIIPLYVMVS